MWKRICKIHSNRYDWGMSTNEKSARGGARAGAGRPRKYEDSQSVTYRFPQALLDAIDAARGELSANEWVVARLTAATKKRT
jgi:hypothetical protein